MNDKKHLSTGAKIKRQEIINYINKSRAIDQVLADMVTDDNKPAVSSGPTIPIGQPKNSI